MTLTHSAGKRCRQAPSDHSDALLISPGLNNFLSGWQQSCSSRHHGNGSGQMGGIKESEFGVFGVSQFIGSRAGGPMDKESATPRP